MSLVEIYEMNLLSLVNPWLDNNYPKQTNVLQCHKNFLVEEVNTALSVSSHSAVL
jgi:hypothetical protein